MEHSIASWVIGQAVRFVSGMERRWNRVKAKYQPENIENRNYIRSNPVQCNLCGYCGTAAYLDLADNWTTTGIDLLRENIVCQRCGSASRHRALGIVVAQACREIEKQSLEKMVVLDTDPVSKLQSLFAGNSGYRRSGYSNTVPSGSELDPGILCVDLQKMPFGNESLNVLISSDVLEHVADDSLSFQEAHRVLRPGGRYIFTVPYAEERVVTQIRAVPVPGGEVVHRRCVQMHGDQKASILARRIYGADLVRQVEAVGFRMLHRKVIDVAAGVFGVDVFEAQKPA